jgi:hypothetical protein
MEFDAFVLHDYAKSSFLLPHYSIYRAGNKENPMIKLKNLRIFYFNKFTHFGTVGNYQELAF